MSLTPIILAAGESKRMGRPKALLDFDGRTAIELILAACQSSTPSHPLVVLGYAAEEIRKALPAGIRSVVNPNYRRGQTSSLKRGLEALPERCSGFLIYPVDCPLVQAKTLDRLLSASFPICVPTFEGRRGHPAVIDRLLLDEFLALGDDEPAHVVLKREPKRVREVAVNDPGVVMKLNTPGDYETALRYFRSLRGAA